MSEAVDYTDLIAELRADQGTASVLAVAMGDTLSGRAADALEALQQRNTELEEVLSDADHVSAKYWRRMVEAQAGWVRLRDERDALTAQYAEERKLYAEAEDANRKLIERVDALTATLAAVRKLLPEHDSFQPITFDGSPMSPLVSAYDLRAILDSSPTQHQTERDAEKPTRLDSELRADFIEAARVRIEEVWADAGPTTAQTLAENIVAAQEFFYLSHQVPYRTEQEAKAEWICGKCESERIKGYDDGQIPNHFRTCPYRTKQGEQA